METNETATQDKKERLKKNKTLHLHKFSSVVLTDQETLSHNFNELFYTDMQTETKN